jgi:hypothetical protein
MMQTLTPAPVIEELSYWEECIRLSWPRTLPDVDIGYVWHMPDNGAISFYTLVFRAQNNNTHKHTHWFLIDPYLEKVTRYTEQHLMFSAIQPSAGVCDTLWKREHTWYTMAITPYAFNISKHYVTGRMVNTAEVLR